MPWALRSSQPGLSDGACLVDTLDGACHPQLDAQIERLARCAFFGPALTKRMPGKGSVRVDLIPETVASILERG